MDVCFLFIIYDIEKVLDDLNKDLNNLIQEVKRRFQTFHHIRYLMIAITFGFKRKLDERTFSKFEIFSYLKVL